jgi:hypothetical protein
MEIGHEQEKEDIYKNFEDKLLSSQKDIPPEFAKIFNDNFKDLILRDDQV